VSSRQFTLPPAEGLSREIGFLLAGMDEVRGQLRRAIESMSDVEISHPAFPGAHSIGALALHIGEAEWWWMNCVIQGHELTDEDRMQPYWDVLKDPDGFAANGFSAGYCLERIAAVREDTRRFLASLDDDDLERIYSHTRRDKLTEHSLRWILHHLIDHEAQHKGQILMLKRLLGLSTEDLI